MNIHAAPADTGASPPLRPPCSVHPRLLLSLHPRLCQADANAPPRLLSLGEDRSLIEFDLARSTIADGVQLTRPPVRIEQTSLPTACL